MANPGDLSPENKDYYDEILETQGPEAAKRFLEQTLMFEQLPQDEVIEGTGTGRAFPGRKDDEVVPGVVFPREETKSEFDTRTKTQQNEAQRELLYMTRGFMMDEETEKALKAATDRYKQEGFPDEDRLKRQYEIEFEQGVPDFDLSGQTVTDIDPLSFNSQEENQILLQLGTYQDMRLKQDLGDRQSAQMKAIDEIYGFSGPRQPSALKAFGETKTPTRAGRIQMNPELADDMGTMETVVESLRPQVIVSGTDVRASKAQEEMDIRDLQSGLDSFLSKDENLDNDVDYWKDIYDTNVQMVANTLAPLPDDVFSMLDQDVREEYEQKYDEAVRIAENYAGTKIQTAIDRIYEKDPDMRRNIETNLDLKGDVFDPKEFGASALSYLVTNKAVPKSMREYLYRGGILEDPDAITESAAMTILRDLGLPLRLVINPAMAQAENLGIIQRRAADEEVETILPAARREYTEDAEGVWDTLSAGLKEAAVETATMRSLGNDLGQVSGVFGIPIVEEMDTTAPVMMRETSGSDAVVGLGTMAELFIPIVPAAKFLSTAGTASRPLLTKGAKLATSSPKAQRFITEAGATTIDVFATGGSGLAFAELARRTVPDLAGPVLKNQYLKSSAAKLGVAGDFARTQGKAPSVYSEALVGEGIVDEVASATVELEIRSRMPKDAADDLIGSRELRDILPYPKFPEVDQAGARKLLDDGLKSESAIVRDIIEFQKQNKPVFGRKDRPLRDVDDLGEDITEATRVDYNQMLDDFGQTYRGPAQTELDAGVTGMPVNVVDDIPYENIAEIAAARYYQLKQPGREYLIKAGIGDYIQLTPRTIVSKKWMDENFGDVTNRMTDNGENRFVEDIDGQTMALDFDEINRVIADIGGFRVNTNDPYFFQILEKAKNGERITFDDFRYFNDRMVEEFARDGITRVVKDTELMDIAKLDFDTAPPILDQAKGIRRGEVAQVFRNTRDILRPVAKSITNTATELKLRFQGTKPKQKAKQTKALDELEADTVDTRNFTSDVDQGFARLDRTTKTTFQQVAKSFSQSEFDGLFPALKGMSKEEQVFVTIMSNQFAGRTFADIQTMSRSELFDNVRDMGRLIDDETGTYADLVLREIIATYAGPLGSKAEIQDFLFMNVRNNSRISIADANQIYENMARQFPELNKVKIDKLDALVNLIISKETKGIITNAARKHFANRPGITSTWSNNPANGMLQVGGTKPVFTNPARYQKFVQDVFDLKVSTPDASIARGEGMLELVRKYNLTTTEFRPRRPLQKQPKPPREPKRVDPPEDPFDAEAMQRFAEYSERMEAYDARVARYEANEARYLSRLTGYDDAQIYVDMFDGGASQNMIDYISGVSGSRFDDLFSPNELVNSFRYKMTLMLDDELKLLTPAEAKVYQKTQAALDTAEGADIFKSNFMKLGQTETGRYARGIVSSGANSARRMLVQGMLGGKVAPNIVYHAENLLSAPLIAYITNPKTTISVGLQVPRSAFTSSTMPYYQLRLRASTNPLDIYPGTRYTNREMFDMFNQYNLGVSSQSIQIGDQLVNDLQNLARSSKDIRDMFSSGKRLGINGLNYFNPNVTSKWMRWADEVDRAFRERIFIDAIRKGSSPATAADQARRVMLDYGMLPDAFREGFGKAFLFFSFTYATSVEMLRAMTTQKGLLRVSALANWHRNMSRNAGTWMFNDNRAYESFWTQISADEEGSTAYTYIRSPYISNIMMLGELMGFGMGYMSGRQERAGEQILQGISRAAYIPGIDIFLTMDKDFKRSVPRQAMIQLMQDTYLPQYIHATLGMGGSSFEYMVDRYNIEVRPPEKNVAGSPSFGGYQYRFRDNAGYRQFLIDQLALNVIGINRTYSDYYNEAINLGVVDVPENYYYGYDKQGTPLFYSFLRERPMRIPKQQEVEIRKVKDTIRRLQTKTQEMKK